MFDSVVRAPVMAVIDRDTLTSRVAIPQLAPGINFMPDARHPFYSFVIALGHVPDLVFAPSGYRPVDKNYPDNAVPEVYYTPWLAGAGIFTATTVELRLATPPSDNSFTLIVSIGIRYGAPADVDVIHQVKHAGSAKVLRVG